MKHVHKNWLYPCLSLCVDSHMNYVSFWWGENVFVFSKSSKASGPQHFWEVDSNTVNKDLFTSLVKAPSKKSELLRKHSALCSELPFLDMFHYIRKWIHRSPASWHILSQALIYTKLMNLEERSNSLQTNTKHATEAKKNLNHLKHRQDFSPYQPWQKISLQTISNLFTLLTNITGD